MGNVLEPAEQVKDLGLVIDQKITSTKHVDARLAKANKVLYLVRRNVSYQTRQIVKLGLYKSLILPTLMYGMFCFDIHKVCP